MIKAGESLRGRPRQRPLRLGSLAVALHASLKPAPAGDRVAFVLMPGKIFAEFGRMLKLRSPFRYAILNAIANGGIGYVPSKALSGGSCGAHRAFTHNPHRR